jgi:hypothetical protein
MDKGRHPHVVRTWTVERTKVPYRPPQSARGPVSRPDRFRPKKGIRPARFGTGALPVITPADE